MTLTPTLLPVYGVEGKAVERNPVCAVPDCHEPSAHGHHIYPRSYLRGQPYEWVQLPYPLDLVVANTIGLCFTHHEWVTGVVGKGHRARLEWADGEGVPILYWIWLGQSMNPLGRVPLDPQPRQGEGRDERGAAAPARSLPATDAHPRLAPGETCAECGYTKPIPREPGPKRAQITWGVQVPRDTEIGAEVLDDWIEQFAAVLGLEGTKGLVRYHVLATVLAWTDQNIAAFIHDIREAGAA